MAIPAGITTGLLLNQFFDRTQQTIDQLKNAGLHLEMEAGAQLRQTIEQAKVAYADSLNLTMDRVDATTRNTFDQLETLVSGVQARNATLMKNMAASAQQIANTLPFHNDRPQLTTVLPRFILRTDQTPILFQFFGNFERAAEQAYAPKLTFHGQDFTATHITIQKLEFSVLPTAVFPGNQLQNAKGVVYSEGTLETYYPGTVFGRTAAVFHLTIGALPPSPGTLTLEYRRDRVQREERLCQTQKQHIGSRKNEGNNDVINHLFKATPSEGWHVKKGTSEANPSCGGRHTGPDFVSDDGDQVLWRGSTIKNTMDLGSESGWMDVTISFIEWQDQIVTEQFTETIDLKWGNTKVLQAADFPLGKWKLIFDSFDGDHHEFAGTDIDTSPYLKIKNQGGGFVIKAVKPKELDSI
ncbi:hypothetical protein [Candidatus Protochlamydia amoebophila]|uniref:Uncharacterized protein n=1 Tax=Protochlamydia amoebophila (strain UWE25) TaxID=264201 RepID=Q6MB07_PARUW|nr:hypothetical protein [Candidatus Protochlamydia amoebophila]CAF24242.1 unnamed protein product [Candidatus Protochlamydia amoebophila UWE25]